MMSVGEDTKKQEPSYTASDCKCCSCCDTATLLRYIPKRIENRCSNKDLYKNVHSTLFK